jgi:hypothetical protein
LGLVDNVIDDDQPTGKIALMSCLHLFPLKSLKGDLLVNVFENEEIFDSSNAKAGKPKCSGGKEKIPPTARSEVVLSSHC